MILISRGDKSSAHLYAPLLKDPSFVKHSLKGNDWANFNCVFRLVLIWPCPTSALSFKCLQEMVGYLERLFSYKIFEISKSFQKQKPFWCLFKWTCSQKNSSNLIVGFYVAFDKNVKWCSFHVLLVKDFN